MSSEEDGVISVEQDFLQHVLSADEPTINFAEQEIGLQQVEIILTVLRVRGKVTIQNCGGVPSLIELGAYIAGSGRT